MMMWWQRARYGKRAYKTSWWDGEWAIYWAYGIVAALILAIALLV
jgi:hypothetical protein